MDHEQDQISTQSSKSNGTRKKSIWKYKWCLPPKRGMVGQRSPLGSSEMTSSCPKGVPSQKSRNEEELVEPSAPSPGSLFFNDENQSDIVLFVGHEPKIWRFPGHSFILATASPVFEAMFGSKEGMTGTDCSPPETNADNGGLFSKPKMALQVDIPDVDPNVFHNLLRFVYTREIRIASVRNTLDILQAANKYMIFDLVHICLDYLNNNLSPSNVLSIYQNLGCCMKRGELLETRHESENLRNELLLRCMNVIDTNAEQILRQDEFSNLESEYLHEILTRDTLQVSSEMSVHEAISTWACQECKRQRKELTAANKSEMLGKNIYCVRYLLMTPHEFVSGPGASGLLSEGDRDFLLERIRGGEKVSKEPLLFHLCNKSLDISRTRPQSPTLCSPTQKFAVTSQRSHNNTCSNTHARKKTVSKRVLQGLGDFVICFIQILD